MIVCYLFINQNFKGSKRKRTKPTYLNSYHLETITGEEDEQTTSSVSDFWKKSVYFPIIDTVIANHNYRFSEKIYHWLVQLIIL